MTVRVDLFDFVELIESTMYLYQATKDPFLLEVGVDILESIDHSAKTKCGYASVSSNPLKLHLIPTLPDYKCMTAITKMFHFLCLCYLSSFHIR